MNLSSACHGGHLQSTVSLRSLATVPATAGLFRLDQLVAANSTEKTLVDRCPLRRHDLVPTGTQAAARDGVDVRLLMPNATDIPLLRPLSRSG